MGKTTTIITRVSGEAEAKAKLDDAKYLREWGFQSSRCAKCGISNSELSGLLLQCARCRKAHYCGLDCLKADYENHNQYCGIIDDECVPSSTDSESERATIVDSSNEPKTVSKKEKVKTASKKGSKGSQSPKPKKKKKKQKEPTDDEKSGVQHSSRKQYAPDGEQGGTDNSPQPSSQNAKGPEKVDPQVSQHKAEPAPGAFDDQKERDQSNHYPCRSQANDTVENQKERDQSIHNPCISQANDTVEVDYGTGATNDSASTTIATNEVGNSTCSGDHQTAKKAPVGRLNISSPQSSKTRVRVDVGKLPTHTIEQFNAHPSPNPGITKRRRSFQGALANSNTQCGTSNNVPLTPELHPVASDNTTDQTKFRTNDDDVNMPCCHHDHYSLCDSPQDGEDSEQLTPNSRRRVGKLPSSSMDYFQSDRSPASGLVGPKRSPKTGKSTRTPPTGSVTMAPLDDHEVSTSGRPNRSLANGPWNNHEANMKRVEDLSHPAHEPSYSPEDNALLSERDMTSLPCEGDWDAGDLATQQRSTGRLPVGSNIKSQGADSSSPKKFSKHTRQADEDEAGRLSLKTASSDGCGAARSEGSFENDTLSTAPQFNAIQDGGLDTDMSGRTGSDPKSAKRGVGRLPNDKFGPFDDNYSSAPRGFKKDRDEAGDQRGGTKTFGEKSFPNGIDSVDFPRGSVGADQQSCSLQGTWDDTHDTYHDQCDDKATEERNGVGKLDKFTPSPTTRAATGRTTGKLSFDSVNCFNKDAQDFKERRTGNLCTARVQHQPKPYPISGGSLGRSDILQGTCDMGKGVGQKVQDESKTESPPYSDGSSEEDVGFSPDRRVGKLHMGQLGGDQTTEPTYRSVGKLPLANMTCFNNKSGCRSSTSSSPGRLTLPEKDVRGNVVEHPSPGRLSQSTRECFESPTRKHAAKVLSADSLPDEAINCFENPTRTPTRRPLRSPGKLKSFAIRAFAPKTSNHAPPPAFSSPSRRKWTPRRRQPEPDSGLTNP